MSNLNYVFSKKFDETFTISFIGGPQEISSGFKFTTDDITNITKLSTFADETEGETSEVYFTKFFKYRNNDTWSEQLPIEQLSGLTISNCSDFLLELYYYKTVDGTSDSTLYVDNIIITGEYKLDEYDSEAILENSGDLAVLKPKDVYKIFSLDDFQVVSNHNDYEIKYRFTQDNHRTFTDWEPLTTENISTVKLSPLRFAMVEYTIENTSTSPLMVYDIILTGDFQNVSANYVKTNRYGLKEDCLTALQNIPGAPGSSNINKDFYTQCLSSYSSSSNPVQDLTNENVANTENMWNPYQFDKITDFANFLGNQVSTIFGWNVEYHLTEGDKNAEDIMKYENTLKNVVAYNNIKVVVPNNKFPIESMIINQFNLDFFDTFEIQIMKDEFKNKFGITKRPSKDDILYICEANALYYVKHAQALKTIMNAATYYKVILEKYEYKTNIGNLVKESQERIEALTKNTTIDDLFGEEQKLEQKKIANKEQTYPTTFDKDRQTISSKVSIINDFVDVDNFYFIKSYYDLSDKNIKNKIAINYKKIDKTFVKGDNRSLITWVNFQNSYNEDRAILKKVYQDYSIKSGIEFNLLDNYYSADKKGYKLYYRGNQMAFDLNDKSYRLDYKLLTNVWYAFVVNLNQRLETLDLKIYKRNTSVSIIMNNQATYQKQSVDSNDTTGYTALISEGYKPITNTESDLPTDLELVSEIEFTIEPVEFTHDKELLLLGSNIYTSNIRLLDDVIPDADITNILKEHILRDEQNIILSDNGVKTLFSTTFINRNWK